MINLNLVKIEIERTSTRCVSTVLPSMFQQSSSDESGCTKTFSTYMGGTSLESPPSILIREISDYGVLTELDNEDVKAVRIDWALAKINTQSMPDVLRKWFTDVVSREGC